MKKIKRKTIAGYLIRLGCSLAIIYPTATGFAQTVIQNGMFGQNANLTSQVGTNPSAGGHLDDYWQTTGTLSGQNYIGASGTKFMRYGGNQVESDCKIDGNPLNSGDNISITIADYIAKAKKMMDNGITPMLTLPLKFDAVNGPLHSVSECATAAGKLVLGVNNGLTAASYAPVLYWVYSNEPDAFVHNYNTSTAPSDIYGYITSYNTAVNAIWNSSWGTIQYVGPELFNYDNYDHGNGLNHLVELLVGKNGTTVDHTYDITPYISYFSWHFYPFNVESTPTTGIPDPTRSNVVDRLTTAVLKHGTTAYTQSLKTDINDLQSWITSYSSNTSVKLAITEANICYKNDVGGTYGTGGTDDLVTGNGSNSFIGGQFWAEMMGIGMQEGLRFMNFWSSLEGCGSCTDANYITDAGFLTSNPSRLNGLGSRKPTYWHYKMLADNFVGGTIFPNTMTASTGYKAFACTTSTRIYILIMNQDIQSPRGTDNSVVSFGVSFHGSTPTSGTMKFSFAMGNTTTHTGGLAGGEYYCNIQKETSMLLAFDKSNGTLLDNKVYGLADAMRAFDPGPSTYIGGSSTVNTQTLYDGYNSSNVYSTISVGVSTGITAVSNKAFMYTTSASVTGPFSCPSGKALSIKPTTEMTCH